MSAMILRSASSDYEDSGQSGSWVAHQDPITGEIVREWVPAEDDPLTPDENESLTKNTFPCQARAIIDGGIRVAGTTERFGMSYENVDFVRLWVPGWLNITKRDRVTNIKDARGRIQWRDEEYEENDGIVRKDDGILKATIFNVNGVSPVLDPFNKMTEQFVLLERVESGTHEVTIDG